MGVRFREQTAPGGACSCSNQCASWTYLQLPSHLSSLLHQLYLMEEQGLLLCSVAVQ